MVCCLVIGLFASAATAQTTYDLYNLTGGTFYNKLFTAEWRVDIINIVDSDEYDFEVFCKPSSTWISVHGELGAKISDGRFGAWCYHYTYSGLPDFEFHVGTTGNNYILTAQVGSSPTVLVLTVDGDNTVIGSADGENFVWGGPGNDVIYGGDLDDALLGMGGMDDIFGGPGGDWIWGGDGDDFIHGGDGEDLIWGEDGNDCIFGGGGDDAWLSGGDGDDLIVDVDGSNQAMYGDAGDDHLISQDSTTTLNVFGGDDADSFWVESGDNTDYSSLTDAVFNVFPTVVYTSHPDYDSDEFTWASNYWNNTIGSRNP